MRKLIDIPDNIVTALKIKAAKANKDLKNYIQDALKDKVTPKKAKDFSGAQDVEEKYLDLPSGFLQWKGTDACIDIKCKCGNLFHEDAEFLYKVKCDACKTVYFLSGHIELIELTNEDIDQ